MTPKQIADAAMSGVREMSYTGMIVIDKSDLLEIIREATQNAYEEGHEHGVGLGRKLGPLEKIKLSKSRPVERRVRPAPDIEDLDQQHPYHEL